MTTDKQNEPVPVHLAVQSPEASAEESTADRPTDEESHAGREADAAAGCYPRHALVVFVYHLLEQWIPVGAVREAVVLTSERAFSRDPNHMMEDPHLAAIAGRLARDLLRMGSKPPPAERLHILVDFSAEDVSYKSLVKDQEEFVEEAAQQVRSAIVERIREHVQSGTATAGGGVVT